MTRKLAYVKKYQKVDKALQVIQSKSKTKQNGRRFLNSVVKLISRADEEIPPITTNSQKRDKALLTFVRSEPLLAGVVSSAVSRDKNRAWTLIGGSRQVGKYANLLHELNDGKGWRHFVSTMANSWYATNFGFIGEIGYESKNGSASTMWTVDPTKCLNTFEGDVEYYSNFNSKVVFNKSEFIQGNSMPSPIEELNFLGHCSVDRALDFSRLMIGIISHQLEKLGVSPPKGILHGKGIKLKEWENALQQAEIDRENMGAYYEGVLALFTDNTDADLKLIGLSQLPDNFSLKSFVDIIMQGYALAFGYPVGEFWAIESGSFGRAGEMEVQVKQATAKGELDFALNFQEQIQQNFLPSTVNFEFDTRNDSGDAVLIEANAKSVEMVVDLVKNLIITVEEARVLLAEANIIPNDWTDTDEDIVATDVQKVRTYFFENTKALKQIQRTNEQIAVYRYSLDGGSVKYYNQDLLRRKYL